MRNWLSKDPGDIIPLYNLASALAGQGKYQDAVAFSARACPASWRRTDAE
jgi:cytochrome c-type biogenesis protein CcmH/NrfG